MKTHKKNRNGFQDSIKTLNGKKHWHLNCFGGLRKSFQGFVRPITESVVLTRWRSRKIKIYTISEFFHPNCSKRSRFFVKLQTNLILLLHWLDNSDRPPMPNEFWERQKHAVAVWIYGVFHLFSAFFGCENFSAAEIFGRRQGQPN